jgi:hypothetical protein
MLKNYDEKDIIEDLQNNTVEEKTLIDLLQRVKKVARTDTFVDYILRAFGFETEHATSLYIPSRAKENNI